MSGAPDVAIVGAGIVGAACASALADEGLRVTVLDGSPPGTGVTAAGMGHVLVMDGTPAELALTRLSRELWHDLAPELPAAVQWDQCGTLWLAQTEGELADARQRAAKLAAAGVATEVLDGPALRGAEPGLAPDLCGALRVADDVVLYPPVAAAWLLGRAQQRGATVRSDVRAARIVGRTIELVGGEAVEAGVVVDAAGLHAVELLATTVEGLAITPKKGHLLITDRYPETVCRHQLLELGYADSTLATDGISVAFNLQPRTTGQLLLGSSRQPGVASRGLDMEVVGRMVQRALRFMPALAGLQVVRAWTGLRPATDDHLPYIGRVPGDPDVILAAGHEGLGITTCTGTAQLVADIVLERASPIDRNPYAPSRAMEARACA